MSTTQSSELDDWTVYRRLVVDTLKRLDERTAELHLRQSLDGNRILLIESRLADLLAVEAQLISHSKSLSDITSERSTEKTIRRLMLIIGGGFWTIVTIALSVWVKALV